MTEQTGALIERVCPACESNASSPRPQFSREPWRVVACQGCGFVYMKTVPDYSRLVEEFVAQNQKLSV